MSINSRAKGARLERAIAIDLRRWLGDDWLVSRNRTDQQCGQDGINAGEFAFSGPSVHPLCWELKSDGGFDERQLFGAPIRGPLPKFWQQCATQAESLAPEVYKHPILVCKRTRGPTLAFVRPRTNYALMKAGSERPVMRDILVNGDTLDGDLLQCWRWGDLLKLNSLCLRELAL